MSICADESFRTTTRKVTAMGYEEYIVERECDEIEVRVEQAEYAIAHPHREDEGTHIIQHLG
jgi:hypothetical protein